MRDKTKQILAKMKELLPTKECNGNLKTNAMVRLRKEFQKIKNSPKVLRLKRHTMV